MSKRRNGHRVRGYRCKDLVIIEDETHKQYILRRRRINDDYWACRCCIHRAPAQSNWKKHRKTQYYRSK